MDIVLASQSPRRRELLEREGVDFRVLVSEADEVLTEEEAADPFQAAQTIADRKAGVVVQVLLAQDDPIVEPTMVIGADTMVVLDGEVFGKPGSASHAKGMLRKLSGRTHQVITGVSCWGIEPNDDGTVTAGRKQFAVVSNVVFRALDDAEIDDYIATGECYDKAGAYAIQGAGGALVDHYSGDLDNIIGLPVTELLCQFPALAPQR